MVLRRAVSPSPVSEPPTRTARSLLMGRVRQRGTSAEQDVGRTLRSLGLRYRKNTKGLPGSPDFSNKSARWALFVNGCFWHHHTNCRKATVPRTNSEFWREKFFANRRRDAEKICALRAKGYRVLIIWGCELGDTRGLVERLSKMLKPRGVCMH